MSDTIFKCGLCAFETDKPTGWRQHRSKSHGGYTREELKAAGLEENAGDRIRMISGFRSGDEVRDAAPESEGAGDAGQRTSGQRAARIPRQSKEEREKAESQAEFDRLRPLLIKKWKRRLRMPYAIIARVTGDPNILLSEQEADEGAELHVEFMQAMGWIHAGKVEAIADLAMWHGAMILSRSDLGRALVDSFSAPTPEENPPIDVTDPHFKN